MPTAPLALEPALAPSSRLLRQDVSGTSRRAGRTSAGRPRGGFSFPEVLVVIGILLVLTALLLPSIGKLRERAVDVVCTGRLHQLLLACRQYASANGDRYPTAAVDSQAPVPNLLPSRLLNGLRSYVGYPAIGRETGTASLPPAVQCPTVERFDVYRGPFDTIDPGVVTYYTGYAYLGGLGRPSGPPKAGSAGRPPYLRAKATPGGARASAFPVGARPGMAAAKPTPPAPGVALRPWRAAAKLGDKGVLWADDVCVSSPAGGFWQFAHPRGGAAPGPQVLTYAQGRDCRGQHRAYAEGWVEWVPAEHLGLSGGEVQAVGIFNAPPPFDASASYKAGSSYWWF